MQVLVDGRRVTVVPRPGDPPMVDREFAAPEGAQEYAEAYCGWLRSLDARHQEESRRRSEQSRQRFIARLRQQRDRTLRPPPLPISVSGPRPREHRPRRRSAGTSSSRGDPPEPEPPLGGQRAWHRQVNNLSDDELIGVVRGMVAVDRAVNAFRKGQA